MNGSENGGRMNSRYTRVLLTLAVTVVGVLALSAVAQAAAGTVEVYDGGNHKEVTYTGTSDVNQVNIGGSLASHTVTIAEAGIADPGAGADPGNVCDLTGPNTLTCTDPKLGVDGYYGATASMKAGNDVVTATGTQSTLIYGDEGQDSLTGSDQTQDNLRGGSDNDTLDGRGDSGIPWRGDTLDGEDGNDVLHGAAGDDYLNGGKGNDALDGGDGVDSLWGDEGVDTLRGGSGDDYLDPDEGDGELSDGGDGSDWISCEGDANEVYDGGPGFDGIGCFGGLENGPTFDPDNYVVDLGGGAVRRTNHVPTVATISSIEDVETGEGTDVLIGTAGANSLSGGFGNDTIDGRGGTDYLYGREGNDTIEAADGAPDRADGGSDADTCHADQADEVFACEALTLAPVPSGSTLDRTAPECKVSRATANRAKGLITFRASCNEAATLGAEAIGHLRRLTSGALASAVGDVTLASRSAKVAANGSVRVTMRVARRYRRALPRRGRIRLVLRASDALGNQSTVRRFVRMR
jgi:Ca2+-binding RTX toxin-like protein